MKTEKAEAHPLCRMAPAVCIAAAPEDDPGTAVCFYFKIDLT